MLPIIASIVSGLISNGLPKVADAVLDKGIDYVQDKLGITLKPEHELQPEDVTKLKEQANKHEEFMVELDFKNIQDARSMQKVALEQDDTFSKRFIYYFATAWSLFAMLYFAFVTFGTVPESGTRMADTILGVLIGTVITGFFNFFYGSSKSSKDKTDALIKGR